MRTSSQDDVRPGAPPTPKSKMPKSSSADAAAFLLNICSSVFIISVNKKLMGAAGFGFRFVVTLNSLHYLTTTAWTVVAKKIGMSKPDEGKGPAHIPLGAVLLLAAAWHA